MKNLLLVLLLSFLSLAEIKAKDTNSELTAQENRTINIYKSTAPSVVNVSNIKVASSFFYEMVEVPQGAGSGYIWDQQGHIVTNYHVIAGGDSFVVSFHKNPKKYKAKLIGAAPRKDIAVLKVEELPDKKLSPIQRGKSSEIQVGQTAIAIGSPFGLDHTMTKGIVSATDRKILGVGGVSIHGMIQTDASINPGNSGGPLIDSQGRMIGMNTMIFSSSGASAGLGFAVPVDTIKRIVPQIIQHGRVIRPGLGIGILPERVKENYYKENGVIITYLDEDGPAAKAGLKGMNKDPWGNIYLGDIILEIDGKKVNSLDDIYHQLENYKIGDTVEVTYLRKDKKKKVDITLGEI